MKKHSSFRMKFHGVRGSRPIHNPDFLHMGGNSTCVEFDVGSNFHLLIDGGTGLANMSYQLPTPLRKKRFHILITHTHWDHIVGIPWFMPLFDPAAHITFYATEGSNGSFPDLFARLFSPGHSSHGVQAIRAKVDFVKIMPEQPFVIENTVRIEGFQLNHQAVTLGYKVSLGDAHVVVITDTAPMTNNNYLGDGMQDLVSQLGEAAFEQQYEERLVQFLRGIQTLVFDTHFNDDNLKPDWGHSTPRIGLELCKKAGVKRLLMFHHAPEDNDREAIAKMQRVHADAVASGIEALNAREEEEWLLKSA